MFKGYAYPRVPPEKSIANDSRICTYYTHCCCLTSITDEIIITIHKFFSIDSAENIIIQYNYLLWSFIIINVVGGTEQHLPRQHGSRRRARRELIGSGGEASPPFPNYQLSVGLTTRTMQME